MTKPRALLVVALLGACLSFLSFEALRFRLPVRVELERAPALWGANRTTRLLNSLYFRQEGKLASSALAADAAWPLDRDVGLVVDESISDAHAEDLRRRVAYLMAPRRVVLVREAGSPRRIVLLEKGAGR